MWVTNISPDLYSQTSKKHFPNEKSCKEAFKSYGIRQGVLPVLSAVAHFIIGSITVSNGSVKCANIVPHWKVVQ